MNAPPPLPFMQIRSCRHDTNRLRRKNLCSEKMAGQPLRAELTINNAQTIRSIIVALRRRCEMGEKNFRPAHTLSVTQ
jgi:hypothetical protein